MLNQVACRERFQGFFIETKHLERAMAFHAALDIAGRTMLWLEANRGRRYRVVAWYRPDEIPAAHWWIPYTELTHFEVGPPRTTKNQSLDSLHRATFDADPSSRFKIGCHSGNVDRGRIFPRSIANAAFFGAMEIYRSCSSNKFTEAERIIAKVMPYQW